MKSAAAERLLPSKNGWSFTTRVAYLGPTALRGQVDPVGGRGHEPVGVERGLPGQDAPGVALRDHGEGVLVPVGRVHPSADGVERPFRHRLANAVPAPEFSQRLPVGDHHADLPSKAI